MADQVTGSSSLNRHSQGNRSSDCPKCGQHFANQGAMANKIRHEGCCSEEERFWFKVSKAPHPKGCWLWTGFLNHDGYGRIGPRKGVHTGMRAHRYAWLLTNPEIAPGKELMHSCDTRACVNPEHLSLGTHAENLLDMRRKGRLCVGEAYPGAKLTDDSVREMRHMWEATGMSFYKLGPLFRVSYSTARAACTRKTWRHVK